ncbi:MAG: hypothetical protein LBI60_03995 [Bacteroidales bacterium]|jgi:hypothetical protein|nr:hypothetical protein [Bacteroidales bacterium]
MKKNKTLFVKQLFFVTVFFLLTAFDLYAQDEPGIQETPEEGLLLFTKEYEDKITAIEGDVSGLKESIKETQVSLGNLSSAVSKPHIWQIISAVSTALIALLLLGTVILLSLKHLRFHPHGEDAEKSGDEKHREEHPLPEENNAPSPGISSDEFTMLKTRLDETQSQLSQLTDKVILQTKGVSRFQDDLTSFRAEITGFKQITASINDAVSLLKTEMGKNREKLARKEQVESNPVAVFNQWAQNPHLPVPQYFTYVTNVKLEFRIKQEFTDTNTEGEWIRNTIGEKKYLFPNPNKIDNLSGPVDKLYNVVGTRKAKGTNSVKITSACQIKEGNFIEYQGELMLM